MDESNENLVDDTSTEKAEPQLESTSEILPQDDAVAYATHKKLLGQFKANQKAARDLAAKVAELETDKENATKSKLEEKQEYKKLYDNALGKIQAMETESIEKDKALVDGHKRRALEKELGGLRKSDYFKFADLGNIVIGDDGLVDVNSVKFEANRYRQEYPELLSTSKKIEVNNRAPSQDGIIKQQKGAKEMSKNDRSNSKRDFLTKK